MDVATFIVFLGQFFFHFSSTFCFPFFWYFLNSVSVLATLYNLVFVSNLFLFLCLFVLLFSFLKHPAFLWTLISLKISNRKKQSLKRLFPKAWLFYYVKMLSIIVNGGQLIRFLTNQKSQCWFFCKKIKWLSSFFSKFC